MNKITLDCSQCGGPLEVTEDMELFRCPHCETPFLVERSEGSIKINRLEKRVDSLEEDHRNLTAFVANKELDKMLVEMKEEQALAEQALPGIRWNYIWKDPSCGALLLVTGICFTWGVNDGSLLNIWTIIGLITIVIGPIIGY